MEKQNVGIKKAQKELNEKEFTRRVLTTLAEDKRTPVDIFSSEFSKVENAELVFTNVTADTNVSYSCTVGYDRKEEYEEWDKSVSRYVKKTRTVTDWKPFNGVQQAEISIFISGEGEENCKRYPINEHEDWETNAKYCSYSVKHYLTESDLSEEEKVKYSNVSNETISSAKNKCVNECFHTVKFPGDRQKDKHYTGTANITNIENHIMPVYKLKYKYQDKEYLACSFSCGEEFNQGKKNKGVQIDVPSAVSDVRKQAMKGAKWLMILSVIPLAGLILLGIFGMLALPLAIGIALGGCVVMNLLGIVIFSIKKSKIYKRQKEIKLEQLQEYLRKNGLNKPMETM